jgi:hypothetical protein
MYLLRRLIIDCDFLNGEGYSFKDDTESASP